MGEAGEREGGVDRKEGTMRISVSKRTAFQERRHEQKTPVVSTMADKYLLYLTLIMPTLQAEMEIF